MSTITVMTMLHAQRIVAPIIVRARMDSLEMDLIAQVCISKFDYVDYVSIMPIDRMH